MKEPAAAPAAKALRRLLVAEDDPAIRDAFSELLTFEGFAVETASDGAEALARLRASPLPELLLLDMMMPNLDGEGVLEALRQEPRFDGLKVIVVSATPLPASPSLGPLAGFIRKPFDPDELMALIRRTLDP